MTSSSTLVGCEGAPYQVTSDGFHFNNTLDKTHPWTTKCTISLPSGNSPDLHLQLTNIYPYPVGCYDMTLPAVVVWEIFKLPLGKDGYFTYDPPNTTFLGMEDPLSVIGQAELELITDYGEVDLTDGRGSPSDPFNHPEKRLRTKKVTECVLSLCSRTYHVSVNNRMPNVTTSSLRFWPSLVCRSPNCKSRFRLRSRIGL